VEVVEQPASPTEAESPLKEVESKKRVLKTRNSMQKSRTAKQDHSNSKQEPIHSLYSNALLQGDFQRSASRQAEISRAGSRQADWSNNIGHSQPVINVTCHIKQPPKKKPVTLKDHRPNQRAFIRNQVFVTKEQLREDSKHAMIKDIDKPLATSPVSISFPNAQKMKLRLH